MYLLYSLILRAQLRSGCLTVFFSLRRALANQLETCTEAATSQTTRTVTKRVKHRGPPEHVQAVTYLDERHVRAQSQEDLLRLGGVGVVPVFVQPVFEWPGHVLQHLSLVADFDATQTRPGWSRR